MEIRNITKNDLQILAKLTKNKTILSINDICFKHSKLCCHNNNILAFILLREKSLFEHFGDEIPIDESIDKNDEDYEEGEEFWLSDMVVQNDHFEIIDSFSQKNVDSIVFANLLHAVEGENGKPQIGILWSKKNLPNNTNFYIYNNDILIDVPIMD